MLLPFLPPLPLSSLLLLPSSHLSDVNAKAGPAVTGLEVGGREGGEGRGGEGRRGARCRSNGYFV